jgi:hypothetical protein
LGSGEIKSGMGTPIEPQGFNVTALYDAIKNNDTYVDIRTTAWTK